MSLLTIEEPVPPAAAVAPWLPSHPLWRLGFRPFYLLAALLAAVAVPLWVARYLGWIDWQPIGLAWHMHEMVFGMAVAVIVGFLLTAVRAWTGLWTPREGHLAALAALWIAGRVALLAAPPLLAALVDLAFLPLAAWPLYRVLRRGGNKRNQFLPVLLVLLTLANALYHAAVLGWIALAPATPVQAADTPGFIVNRIARPFYGEALRIYEEGIADMATIDWAMRDIGGFRMGPFELMDFIGNDINLAATKSVYEAMFHDSRFRPFITQQRLLDAGYLGRKTGRGYYDYAEGAVAPEPTRNAELGDLIFRRILSMLINQAAEAVYYRIATARDADLAMTLGVNYPKGLLQWADEIGIQETVNWLSALHEFYGEERYRPSPLLKTMAADGFTFFSH